MIQGKYLACQDSNHEGEEIIGFCLDLQCQMKTKQYCQKCWVDPQKHKNCRPNCLSFSQISKTLEESHKIFCKLIEKEGQQLQIIQNKYENFKKHIEQVLKKFKLIQENINQMDYSSTKQNLNLIKECHIITINNFSQKQFQFIQQSQSNQNINDTQNLGIQSKLLYYETLLKTGVKVLDQKDLKQAIDELVESIKETEKKLSFQKFFLSIALIELNQPGEGKIMQNKAQLLNPNLSQDILQGLKKELNLDSQNRYALMFKSYALEMDKQYQAALEACDKVINIYQNDLHALCQKAHILKCQEKYQQSEECLNKVFELNSSYILAMYLKGNILLTKGDYLQAINFYDKCLSKDSKFSGALCNKGTSLLNLNKNIEAQECFQKAIRVDDDFAIAYYNYGLSLSKCQKFEQAVLYYSQALKINKCQKFIYLEMGKILSHLNRFDEAKVIYKDAIQYCQRDKEEFEKLIQTLNPK